MQIQNKYLDDPYFLDLRKGQPWPPFTLLFIFIISARIIRVEGKDANHFSNTMAHPYF